MNLESWVTQAEDLSFENISEEGSPIKSLPSGSPFTKLYSNSPLKRQLFQDDASTELSSSLSSARKLFIDPTPDPTPDPSPYNSPVKTFKNGVIIRDIEDEEFSLDEFVEEEAKIEPIELSDITPDNIPGYEIPESFVAIEGLKWYRSLSIYKTPWHDKNWSYMYVTDQGKPFANVVYDRYPKSMIHLIVLPMTINASEPKYLVKDHLNDLQKIHNLAYTIVKGIRKQYPLLKCKFKVGYHVEPTMSDLHLHILSDDFVSEFLKKSKQYVSFTYKNWFVASSVIEKQLKEYGDIRLKRPQKAEELICHRCEKKFNKFDLLKEHLNKHLADIL